MFYTNNGTLGNMTRSYQQAENNAVASNERRYADILNQYNQLQSRTSANLDTLGTQARKDINTTARRGYANSLANMIKSGAYGTTQGAALDQQTGKRKNEAMGNLNANLLRTRYGIESDSMFNKLAFMERRSDTYPDMNQYLNLTTQYGAS